MLRFAPSPIGDMSIGNLRVAILNYIVAKQRDDSFLVRIEDIDKSKNIEGKDTEIMMLLEKFAIKHDGVYHQSERFKIHQNLALRLIKDKKAFRSKSSSKESVIKIENPMEDIVYNDIIKGKITTSKNDINNFIILKEDGTPTSNFASACDDMLSGVDFIIRDEKYLDNTSKQIHIKNLLGYTEDTKYAHLPTILSDDNIYVKSLFEKGFIPDAILNYLILLENINAPKEIFFLSDAIEWFDLTNISKKPIKFDIEKLRFLNREHLKLIDNKELSKVFGFADSDIGRLAKLYLEETATLNELKDKIQPIFKPKDFSGEWGEQMRIIENIINNAPALETFDEFREDIIKKSGLEGENLSKPLQILLTGAEFSPELSEIYPLIKSYILEVAS